MIYITKHKPVETPKMDGYKDIYIGELCDYLDEDNINYLTKEICELTSIYRINQFDDEIKGQVQYRRFFLYDNDVLTFDKAKELLNEYDMIITERYIVGNGIYLNLRGECNEADKLKLDRYVEELEKREPGIKEYLNQTYFSPRQMFICKKDLYKKYCDWIFPLILPIIDIVGQSDTRFSGYVIERLLNYFIQKNNLKTIELPYNTTMERIDDILNREGENNAI